MGLRTGARSASIQTERRGGP